LFVPPKALSSRAKTVKSLVFQARGQSRLNRLNLIRGGRKLAKLLKQKNIFFLACARKTSLARCTNEDGSLHLRFRLAPQTLPLASSTCPIRAGDTIAASYFSSRKEGIAAGAAISCRHRGRFAAHPRWKNDSFPLEGAGKRQVEAVCIAGTLARPTRIAGTVALRSLDIRALKPVQNPHHDVFGSSFSARRHACSGRKAVESPGMRHAHAASHARETRLPAF
jgi:hypothetical protein